MEDLSIAIPSRGRAGNVETIAWLPADILDRLELFVRADEHEAYRAAYPDLRVTVVPEWISAIPAKRQWIVEQCTTRYLMQIDDDVMFYRRDGEHESGTPRLRNATPEEVGLMIREMLEKARDGYAHVGVSMRPGNNRFDGDGLDMNQKGGSWRVCHIFLHDLAAFKEHGIRWDRMTRTMEDFDVTLQLLRAGCSPYMFYKWSQHDKGLDAPGGCSEYRDEEVWGDAVAELQALHPDVVRLRENAKGTPQAQVEWRRAFRQRSLFE